jgi:uronate dehydrogenase
MEPQRVLVTGGAGVIGTIVVRALKERGHFVRSLDKRGCAFADENLIADIADGNAVAGFAESVDTIVHLAATTDDADFLTQLLPNNFLGTFHVYEAARRQGVRRVIVASSIQVGVAHWPENRPVTTEDRTQPFNLYGVSKVYAEAMGQAFAVKHKVEVIAARVVWLPRNPHEANEIKKRGRFDHYLSHDDCGRFFSAATEATLPADMQPRYAAFWVVSKPKSGVHEFDLAPAKALLGWEPKDVWMEGVPFTLEEINGHK